jgi:hypothetical protein
MRRPTLQGHVIIYLGHTYGTNQTTGGISGNLPLLSILR